VIFALSVLFPPFNVWFCKVDVVWEGIFRVFLRGVDVATDRLPLLSGIVIVCLPCCGILGGIFTSPASLLRCIFSEREIRPLTLSLSEGCDDWRIMLCSCREVVGRPSLPSLLESGMWANLYVLPVIDSSRPCPDVVFTTCLSP